MPSVENAPEVAPAATLGQQIDVVTGFLRRRYLIILACLVLSLPLAGL